MQSQSFRPSSPRRALLSWPRPLLLLLPLPPLALRTTGIRYSLLCVLLGSERMVVSFFRIYEYSNHTLIDVECLQTDKSVVITIMLKGCKKESVQCSFEERSLSVDVALPLGSTYKYDLRLFEDIIDVYVLRYPPPPINIYIISFFSRISSIHWPRSPHSLELDLYAPIVPAECSYNVMSTKVFEVGETVDLPTHHCSFQALSKNSQNFQFNASPLSLED